jgi:hypothetical protein
MDAVRALNREARRLQSRCDGLVDDARWGLQTHTVLRSQIEAQYAAIRAIYRSLPPRTALS